MHLILSAGLAGGAVLMALILVALTFILAGLRRDGRTIRDAEELKTVDLSRVISSHVPMAQRTNFPEQEIVLAKESVTRKRRSFGRAFQVSAVLFLIAIGANVGWHGWLKPKPAATGRRADATSPVPPPVVDPIAAVAGTWGWKFNALLSCKENPHTITLSQDQHTLSIRFHTALPTPAGDVDGYDYDIVRIEPNELVLRLLSAPGRRDSMGRPLEWAIHFEDKNTYYLKRSDVVTQDTGEIIRCMGTS
jgi:hypothetical protein